MSTVTQTSLRPVWDEEPSLLGKIGKALALALVTLAVLFPLYIVVLTSISSAQAINEAGGLVIVPNGFSFDAYAEVLGGGVVLKALTVSIGITVVGTALSLSVTAMAAYGLSRPGSLLHRPLLFAVLITFLFGPGIIPSYIMVYSLGLLDSYASLILPAAISAFNLVVLRAFFMAIPGEVIESARIEGATDFQIFRKIVLPLSKAALAVIGLFYAVAYWNAFFNALLYLNDSGKWPLQLVLRTYILQGQPMQTASGVMDASGLGLSAVPVTSVRMAVLVLAMIPVVLIYPFIQRHFIKGVIIGAVKG
ncbi:carbohydrate ABC transporter permease [Nonomuraea soli]|uniref:Putative aldouronate transport system permease protein n=1 Tax=Nonomuraea soli TaxID=1032476 RepID=A0A7W0CJW6_9ACTN|nr:carbohydrate ABC transporter permease [Nonomuraea soli]MBA2892488.1 putative aldouronate transport system permease protein [Nonomuraea soli]